MGVSGGVSGAHPGTHQSDVSGDASGDVSERRAGEVGPGRPAGIIALAGRV